MSCNKIHLNTLLPEETTFKLGNKKKLKEIKN